MPPATGTPSTSPSHCPFRIERPFVSTSREAIVTAPVATSETTRLISATLSARDAHGSNATAAASPACKVSVGMTETGREAASAACSAVRKMFGSFGRITASRAPLASTAARSSAVDGFIVRPPSTTWAPRLSNRCRFPWPEATATSAHGPSSAPGTTRQQALLAIEGLRVHVRDLDRCDRAASDSERQRAPGVVGVDVDLERRRVADDEDRVAERLELRLDLVGVEPVALDHERGAVLELREPEMDRVDARRALLDARRRRAARP